ncbi:gliding motility-associated C-terminal domain-containing protein [Hymenobacter sp. DH14]|uniref:Gliding motility-associated C-terminal domain-containing protein n=1 Tax=Hymenobacter cyanobacteriorum TaxID=2926463 RepID=A0A9X1VIA7_9BACT|nr:gliding motility-associated C-terminal domain-containing protein [Hymenobacter cyanobacteriorum]MCI1189208.1 gliding motility-associated C-terminal domain-containing protein [Hymenobacter cyanobacteriorum]
MTTLFSLRVRSGARLALALLGLLAFMALRPDSAHATHLRAGDIKATYDTTTGPSYNPRRVFFRMVLYTDISNSAYAKQPTATIFFGDGTATCPNQEIPRTTPDAVPVPSDPRVGSNVYLFEHIYPASGTYVVSFVGENRNGTVRNMATPSTQNFYIATTIYLDPTLRGNHGAILRAPAIDRGAMGQIFLHNPAAYDADGDSLAFRLAPSRQVPGGSGALASVLGPPCVGTGTSPTGTNRPELVAIPCTGYHYPNDPVVAAPAVKEDGTSPATFEIDARTGQLTWNAPVAAGEYNVAIEILEYRRSPGGFDLIGLVIRDMQITIAATSNVRPKLTIPADLCVVAGTQVRGVVTAVDGTGANTTQTPVTLFAYSGILPPATFVQTQAGPPTATANFTWNTACNNVAKEPYLVVFKAQDNPSPNTNTNPPLIDEKTWRITVVGPPPQNLVATPVANNNVQLTWDSYTCTNAQYMYVYRKEGPSTGFVPGGCLTGIPASAGYTLIKRVAASDLGYLDNNPDATGTARGLKRGVNYCYRIYAGFPPPALGESIASNEACTVIPGREALLTKVDVATTGTTTGQIQVCWTQPRTGTSAAFTGTASYVLARAEGLNPAVADFRDIATITSLADTCYTDGTLNTLSKQYTYKLSFVRTFPAGQGAAITETTAPASSVRTSAVPRNGGTAATVSWTFNVPWDNTAQLTQVFRKGPGTTGAYVQVGTATSTATGGTYADNDPTLVKNQQYCYYVRTVGRYAAYPFLNNLPNRSQENCVVLSAPPCTPQLTLLSVNCDSLASLQEFPRQNDRYVNRLRWTPLTNTPAGCDASNLSYNVFYRPSQSGPFRLVGTTTATSFVHTDLIFSAGCYRVQAVASSGLVSDSSNVVCQDNCLFFKLPNIFTPNGDGQNAVFRPKNYSPIRSIHFQAYNRWGVKVFENTTTASDRILINWDGGGAVTENTANRKVSDGVYFYLAEVEFADFANTKRTYKGWVEIVR